MKEAEAGDDEVKNTALRALWRYDARPYHRRIVQIYAKTEDCAVRIACIGHLRKSDAPGVVEAMAAHLRFDVKSEFKGWSMGHAAALAFAMDALNERLDLELSSPEEMLEYLEKRDAK